MSDWNMDMEQEDKQGIKLKEGAIKCCKETNTLSPKEWYNIPISR